MAFQSTLPRGSDGLKPKAIVDTPLISIHAPLRERPDRLHHAYGAERISIHAPLRERRLVSINGHLRALISIHAPLRERHRYYA